ncbi:MAG: hypothetical protein AB7O96_06345 [Pseudobdellovibrionaceae bacterium]
MKGLAILFSSLAFLQPAAWAQASSVGREAMVESAFEVFMPVIYFLSGAEDFRASLSKEEAAQFELLGHYLIKHAVRVGPPSRPGEGNTPNHIDFKLKFSDRSEDFVLSPGEPERTAKVLNDVWFNLNIINNPKNSFSFLDILQILVHEFGHKLEEKKDQAAIDRVAAKIRAYMSPYSREYELKKGLTAHTFILPYLMILNGPVDFQAEPIVLVNRSGRYTRAITPVADLVFPGQGYLQAGAPTQDYKRVVLKPEFKIISDKVRVTWDIQIRHYLVEAPVRFNYLRLLTRPESVASDFAVAPMPQNRKYFSDFSESDLATDRFVLRPKGTQDKPYAPAAGRWLQTFKVVSEDGIKATLEAVISSESKITLASVTAEFESEFLEYPAQVTAIDVNSYKIKVEIPRSSISGNSILLLALNLNSSVEWEFSSAIEVKTVKVKSDSLKIQFIAAGSNEGWTDIRKLGAHVKGKDIRILFKIESEALLNHIEVTWLIYEGVMLNGKEVVLRTRNVREIFPASEIQQKIESGILTFSIRSERMMRDMGSRALKSYSIKDKRYRGIITLSAVTQSNQRLNLGNRMAPTVSEWRSLYEISPVP